MFIQLYVVRKVMVRNVLWYGTVYGAYLISPSDLACVPQAPGYRTVRYGTVPIPYLYGNETD